VSCLCGCGIWFCCENRSFADSSSSLLLVFKAMMPVSCSISLSFSIIFGLFVCLFFFFFFLATYKSSKAFVDMLGLIVRFVVMMRDALQKLDP